MVWKLEKFDFKLRKTELDTKFSCKCKNNDIIPIFLWFWTANTIFKNSNTYKQYQKCLLVTGIDMKISHLQALQKELF